MDISHKFSWDKCIHAWKHFFLSFCWHLISHTIPYENMSKKHLLNLYFHFKYFCHVASFILVFYIPFVCYLKAWIMRVQHNRIYHTKFQQGVWAYLNFHISNLKLLEKQNGLTILSLVNNIVNVVTMDIANYWLVHNITC
jgi:hypothetical protein